MIRTALNEVTFDPRRHIGRPAKHMYTPLQFPIGERTSLFGSLIGSLEPITLPEIGIRDGEQPILIETTCKTSEHKQGV